MKLNISGNINSYYVQTLCMIFFPGEKFSDKAEEDPEVATPEFIKRMHSDGVLVWANAIIYNYKDQLAAGHSDDTAICESADKGWGWLAKRGFDFIQTDWTAALTKYLNENGLLYRKSK